MANRIKIHTLKTKLETMILALDGPPDFEEAENKRLMDAFKATSAKIKTDLIQCKDQLTDRTE